MDTLQKELLVGQGKGRKVRAQKESCDCWITCASYTWGVLRVANYLRQF